MNFKEFLLGFVFKVAISSGLVNTLAESDDQDQEVYSDVEADDVKKVEAKLVAYRWVFDVEREEKKHLNSEKDDKLVEDVDEVADPISHRLYANIVAQQEHR